MMPVARLKVLRETYCSQQVVDTAVGWVKVHSPELIEQLMEDEHWREQDYSERAWDILEYLTEEKLEIPTSPAEAATRPLASGPDQPLPPLI